MLLCGLQNQHKLTALSEVWKLALAEFKMEVNRIMPKTTITCGCHLTASLTLSMCQVLVTAVCSALSVSADTMKIFKD